MECFTGTIIPWPIDFEPVGWMYCWGQMLNIREYQVLYSVIGTRYGGDGRETFRLPDLRENVAIGSGKKYSVNKKGGNFTASVQESQMPAHTHMLQGNINPTVQGYNTPDSTRLLGVATTVATRPVPIKVYNKEDSTKYLAMYPATISPAGSGLAHSNEQPDLSLNYIICTDGIYPIRRS